MSRILMMRLASVIVKLTIIRCSNWRRWSRNSSRILFSIRKWSM